MADMYINIMSPDCKTAEVAVGKIAPNDVTNSIVGKTVPDNVTKQFSARLVRMTLQRESSAKLRLGDIAAVALRLE